MEKMDPLFQQMQIFRQKNDPFFQNRGHTDFEKTDPFSVNFRTMIVPFIYWSGGTGVLLSSSQKQHGHMVGWSLGVSELSLQ